MPKIYCLCRQPDDGRFMIQCDTCSEWFHGDCVQIQQKEAEELNEYSCPSCDNAPPRPSVGNKYHVWTKLDESALIFASIAFGGAVSNFKDLIPNIAANKVQWHWYQMIRSENPKLVGILHLLGYDKRQPLTQDGIQKFLRENLPAPTQDGWIVTLSKLILINDGILRLEKFYNNTRARLNQTYQTGNILEAMSLIPLQLENSSLLREQVAQECLKREGAHNVDVQASVVEHLHRIYEGTPEGVIRNLPVLNNVDNLNPNIPRSSLSPTVSSFYR